ncbi:MAG TPA: hypothetical protein VF059_04060 [Casimicrobiaceae bacterium]
MVDGRWQSVVDIGQGANRAYRFGRSPLTLAAVLALATVLYGCAPSPRGPEPRDLVCHSAEQCRVEVTVTCAPACSASVEYQRVFAKGHDVVWEIANTPGQSYVFDREAGIAFKTPAGRQAFRCNVEANGKRYGCRNGKAPGEYEYGVRLSGSPPVPPIDPWVVNN